MPPNSMKGMALLALAGTIQRERKWVGTGNEGGVGGEGEVPDVIQALWYQHLARVREYSQTEMPDDTNIKIFF